MHGKRIKTLLSGTWPEGYYEAGWMGKDASGRYVENGIYFIRLTANNKTVNNEKVVLIR